MIRLHQLPRHFLTIWAFTTIILWAAKLESSDKKEAVQYGAGLTVNVPAPESEVAQAVQQVAQNGIIHGTKEYNKDEYITGATFATDSRLFPAWTEGGKIFYKVRLHALDPRNFKDSGDMGTLAVRYIVIGQNDRNTVLRIDALFVEEFRRRVHPSNGSVEGSEYKDIHDHIEAIELLKQETADAEKQKKEFARQRFLAANNRGAAQPTPEAIADKARDTISESSSVASSTEALEQQVTELRKQVERRVKAPGAPLKSAPFHTANTLQSLPAGTEVLIVISTTYWYGVETHEGQHGWILRDDLEELP